MSNKISFGIKKYKHFTGYLYDDYKIELQHIIFPKATIYVNNYDGQTKWMYFLIESDDDDLLEKYNTIWGKVRTDIKQ